MQTKKSNSYALDLADLFRRHRNLIMHTLLKKGIQQRDLEDECSNVYLMALQYQDSYDAERGTTPLTWLNYMITRTVADRYHRSTSRRAAALETSCCGAFGDDADEANEYENYADDALSPERSAALAQFESHACDTLDAAERAIVAHVGLLNLECVPDADKPAVAAAAGLSGAALRQKLPALQQKLRAVFGDYIDMQGVAA